MLGHRLYNSLSHTSDSNDIVHSLGYFIILTNTCYLFDTDRTQSLVSTSWAVRYIIHHPCNKALLVGQYSCLYSMCPSTSPVRVFVCTPEPRLYAAYDRAATFSSAKKYKTSDDRYDHPSDISIEFNIISSSRTERGMFISISHASGSYIGLQLHARESVNRRPFSHA